MYFIRLFFTVRYCPPLYVLLSFYYLGPLFRPTHPHRHHPIFFTHSLLPHFRTVVEFTFLPGVDTYGTPSREVRPLRPFQTLLLRPTTPHSRSSGHSDLISLSSLHSYRPPPSTTCVTQLSVQGDVCFKKVSPLYDLWKGLCEFPRGQSCLRQTSINWTREIDGRTPVTPLGTTPEDPD